MINNTVFNDNLACECGALYIYDSYYNITQSYFENNDENVHTLFDHEYSNCDESNNFVNGENIINDKEYVYVYEGIGEEIPINPIVLDKELINASRFDLRDYGLVPTVRDQGYMGSCWAFGATGALESALLMATNKSFNTDISENNIKNNVLYYSKHGVYNSEGSYSESPASYFTSWLGIVPSNDDAYDELGKIGSIIDNGTKYHIYEFKILSNNNTSNISVYKEALIEHGAISTMVNADYENNFNTTTYAHYYPNGTEDDLEHEVVIVGWDDNFSKYNFLTTPPGDGAWIIRNSWGEDWADHGHYYLSYYDTAFRNYTGQLVYIVNGFVENLFLSEV
ncbi:MAG: hypothetical protein E7Z84_00525 [Methanosphaera stadtmanae]|nr:hypothetical protein [Methanosphaera stadtmanae]